MNLGTLRVSIIIFLIASGAYVFGMFSQALFIEFDTKHVGGFLFIGLILAMGFAYIIFLAAGKEMESAKKT